jgi:hypothetical protein
MKYKHARLRCLRTYRQVTKTELPGPIPGSNPALLWILTSPRVQAGESRVAERLASIATDWWRG